MAQVLSFLRLPSWGAFSAGDLLVFRLIVKRGREGREGGYRLSFCWRILVGCLRCHRSLLEVVYGFDWCGLGAWLFGFGYFNY